MGFQSGLSGLNAATKHLDVIGNNVANSGVVGFKGSRALFADVYANSAGGSSSSTVGIGAKVAAVSQEFAQGNISSTNNPLDVAINGKGFYRMSESGTVTYSRNGQFHFDKDGYIINTDGLRLTGYGVDATGTVIATAPVDLRLSSADIAPTPTSRFSIGVNLDSRLTVPATPAFSQTDATSYNRTTSGTVYDSLGNPHVMSFYFLKTATAGQWQVYGSIDGTALANVNLGAGAGSPATLNFNTIGALSTAMPITAAVTVTNGAASPLSFSLDLTGSTHYGNEFSVNALSQDGFTSGRLSGFNVSANGTVQGRYSNGQAKNLGQIVLVDFANPNGLQPLGQNQWAESADSGLPVVGQPGSGTLGVLQASAVEDSNVDLTAELVNMITAQRTYQANAQTIKPQDQVLQTLVNLR